jgi:hypothetical protein
MQNLKDKLKVEEENLNIELEESHGDPNKMKVALEKKINLYIRFLKEDDLSDLDRLSLENKKEWALCQHLILILEKESSKKITDLTKRVYRLEKAVQLD